MAEIVGDVVTLPRKEVARVTPPPLTRRAELSDWWVIAVPVLGPCAGLALRGWGLFGLAAVVAVAILIGLFAGTVAPKLARRELKKSQAFVAKPRPGLPAGRRG